jgi:phage shock protein A
MHTNGAMALSHFPERPRRHAGRFAVTLSTLAALTGGGTSLASYRAAAQVEERVHVHTEELRDLSRKLDTLNGSLNTLNEHVATLNGQLHPIPVSTRR